MELRDNATSLRRTHEVEPVSGEPKTTAPEEMSQDEANEASDESGGADAHASKVTESNSSGVSLENLDVQTPSALLTKVVSKNASRAKSSSAREDDVPVKGAYRVELPEFEGPLDLLLHLIQQHELDIKDIPIAFVSEKYLEYILLMQDLNIDLASEYLVMAATLAHIKSKMLLPKPPADQEDDAAEDLDPRGELVRRLLEYQKYKHAAEHLGQAPVLGRDVFVRGAPAPSVDGPAPLAQVSVFKLFDAFQRLLSKAKQTAEHLIDVDKISISERIIQLTDLLRGKGRVPFVDLFDENTTRSDLIVSFLAVLEMNRLRMMAVIQEGSLAPIEIELTLAEEHDEILKQDHSLQDPLSALARGDVIHTAAQQEEGINPERTSDPVSSESASVEDDGLDESSRDDAGVSVPSVTPTENSELEESERAPVEGGDAPHTEHD